jgi:hypothetical protein
MYLTTNLHGSPTRFSHLSANDRSLRSSNDSGFKSILF